jgi:hypothetical protein
MYVLVLVAVYYVADAKPVINVVTTPTIYHYPSKEACNADGPKQAQKFLVDIPSGAIGLAGKCVEATAAGKPA